RLRNQAECASRRSCSLRRYCQNAGALRKSRKQIQSKRIGRQETDHTRDNRLGTDDRFAFTGFSLPSPLRATLDAAGGDCPFHTPRANAPRATDPLAHRPGLAGLRLSSATPATPPRRNVSRDTITDVDPVRLVEAD